MESAVLEFLRDYFDSLPPDLDQQPKAAGVFSFGDSKRLADELAALVRQGIKTATCSALMGYEKDKTPLPQKDVGCLRMVQGCARDRSNIEAIGQDGLNLGVSREAREGSPHHARAHSVCNSVQVSGPKSSPKRMTLELR